jgi:hypothetical protein
MVAGVIVVGLLFIGSEIAFAAVQRLMSSPGLKPPSREETGRIEASAAAV